MGKYCSKSLFSLSLLAFLGLALVACETEGSLPTKAIAAPTIAEATQHLGFQAPQATVPATFTVIPSQVPITTSALNETLVATPESTVTPIIPTRTATPTPTATPTFTPTRYISVLPDLPPSDDLGPSKLGIHVVRNNDPAIMEFVRRAQPSVVKAIDDLGFLAEVREVSPRSITVGRHSVQSQDYLGDPEEEAQRFVADHLEIYRANPAVDYWEGWNEPDPNIEYMAWYARFEQERVRQMAAHGFRCAIGSFATGVPEMDEFALFLPAIATAKEYDGVLSLHEYSAPDMTYLYGSPLPGFPAYADRGSLTFRYRWFYREFLEPSDLVIPLIITEAGIDGIIGNRPGPSGTGWSDFQTYWEQQGLGTTGKEAFIKQLAWYDAGVRQDGYVIGFTIFTAGGIGNWKNYDINPILPELGDYVVSQG